MFDHFFHQHLLQHVEYVKADGIIFLLGGGLNQLIRQLRDFVEGTNEVWMIVKQIRPSKEG